MSKYYIHKRQQYMLIADWSLLWIGLDIFLRGFNLERIELSRIDTRWVEENEAFIASMERLFIG